MRLLGRSIAVSICAVAGSLAFAAGAGAQANASCWGQATKAFASTGVMGEHASEQEVPRVGLRNLARSLAADETIPDDSMQALGAFVATVEGLEVEACGT